MTADGICVIIKQLFESITDDGRKQSSVQQTSFLFVGVEEQLQHRRSPPCLCDVFIFDVQFD